MTISDAAEARKQCIHDDEEREASRIIPSLNHALHADKGIAPISIILHSLNNSTLIPLIQIIQSLHVLSAEFPIEHVSICLNSIGIIALR